MKAGPMLADITTILQSGSSLAIDIMTDIYGVECKIYYPKDTGHYSGRHGDVEYNSVHDDELRILIPELFNTQRSSLSGVFDNLFTDEFSAYLKHDKLLPFFTKIVATSTLQGTVQFYVKDSDSISTFNDKLYRKLLLVPYMKMNDLDSEVNEVKDKLTEEYQGELDAIGANPNNDIVDSNVTDKERSKYKYNPLGGKKS
ncbi:structural protein [Yersinia phage YerA41]|nr:structural protein [Yersinia phage YerA41]